MSGVKKIAFLFSAMRHFADALRSAGYAVRYVALQEDGNSQSIDGEILRASRIHNRKKRGPRQRGPRWGYWPTMIRCLSRFCAYVPLS